MKKILSLMLVLCITLTLFAGCSGSDEGQALSTSAPQDATEETTEATKQEAASDAAIAETVVYDADGVKITATGLDTSSLMGPEVNFLVENNTDRNLVFSGDYFNVNGITVYGWLYIEAAAGTKANGSLQILSDTAATAGITEIATVSGPDASLVDTDTFETIASAPFSVESSIAGTYVQQIDDSGEVIFDDSGITVVAKTLNDSLMGKSVLLLVKNGTEQDFNAEAENISVNGYTIDAWMYDTVYAGTCAFCTLELYATSLEENGIETVEDVSFTLNFINTETYETIASGQAQVVPAG